MVLAEQRGFSFFSRSDHTAEAPVQRRERLAAVPDTQQRFSLFRVLQRIVPAIHEQLISNHPEYANNYRKLRAALKQELMRVVAEQYASVLREELHLPIHEDLLFSSLGEDGQLKVQHPLFPHGDLLFQAKLAIEQSSSSEQRARYTLEYDQLETILRMMQRDLLTVPHAALNMLASMQSSEWDMPTGFMRFTAPPPQKLTELLRAHNLSPDTPIYVAAPHFSVLPTNAIYPDGFSFWVTYQQAYVPALPAGKQFPVFLSQHYAKFSDNDHRQMLRLCGADIPETATESEFMNTIVPLSGNLWDMTAVDRFSYLLSVSEHETDSVFSPQISMRAQQQTTIAEFQQRAATLPQLSEYLAEILLFEYEQSDDFAQSAQILDSIAHEMVMRTLLSQSPFDLPSALKEFRKRFAPKTRMRAVVAQGMRELHDDYFTSYVQQNPSALSVLGSYASQVDCAVGSFAQIQRMTALAQNANALSTLGMPTNISTQESLVSWLSHPENVTDAQIRHLLGPQYDSYEAGKQCVACGMRTFKVGPCGVCGRCELLDTYTRFLQQNAPEHHSAIHHSEPNNVNQNQQQPVESPQGRMSITSLLWSTLSPASYLECLACATSNSTQERNRLFSMN